MKKQEATPGPTARRGIGRWVVLAVIGIPSILGTVILAILVRYNLHMGRVQANPYMLPPEVLASERQTQDLVGNLGGRAVRVPKELVGYVEYEGDPGIGERRQGAVSVRTAESEIRSFGMRATVEIGDTPSMRFVPVYGGSKESGVTITAVSGSYFPGDGFLDRAARNLGLDPRTSGGEWELHSRPLDGLEAWRPSAAIAASSATKRFSNNEIYILRDPGGHVSSLIRCSKYGGSVSICAQDFQFPGLRLQVTLNYGHASLNRAMDFQSEFIAHFKSFLH